jgi:rod shape determining protein RodA
MNFTLPLKKSDHRFQSQSIWQTLHIDIPLLLSILSLIGFGLVILYSAGNQDRVLVEKQCLHIGVALFMMLVFAQIPPITYQRWSPWLYFVGVTLLFAVLIIGHIKKGGQRWFNLGFFHFQPSEMMKLAIPMLLAWYFHRIHLPLPRRSLFFALILILIPVALTIKQPDLGTGILLAVAGGSVLLFAGLSWRLLFMMGTLLGVATPIIWHFLYEYQRQRVLTFLNPELDPLGKGYHIIQSKIAIGSGGFFGKGWLKGTQSHLHFLPEHTTDFIFGVCGEEFGFFGGCVLIALFMTIILRGFYIAVNAQDTYTRLLAGSISLTFFMSFFINIGMVTGILPVVGLPLPLVSYGGSSIVTIMTSFGILMSIQTHRKLLTT